ncbi:hypothetical protein PBY51_006577 [Eleginops maclovinus]|uniref:Uncharacterized protein n=1 Tax=Eleginops maclovinus TaxID=56733 RepID=A0AAN8AF70_ELEMC|nr:hypothetical protein PBY51_006577 [Eleginops maclovinus]
MIMFVYWLSQWENFEDCELDVAEWISLHFTLAVLDSRQKLGAGRWWRKSSMSVMTVRRTKREPGSLSIASGAWRFSSAGDPLIVP